MTSCLNNDVRYGLVIKLELGSEAKGGTGSILDKRGTVCDDHWEAFDERHGSCIVVKI